MDQNVQKILFIFQNMNINKLVPVARVQFFHKHTVGSFIFKPHKQFSLPLLKFHEKWFIDRDLNSHDLNSHDLVTTFP